MSLFFTATETRFQCFYTSGAVDNTVTQNIACMAVDAIARDKIFSEFIAKTQCEACVATVAQEILRRASLLDKYTSMPYVRDITFWVALQIAQKFVGGTTFVSNNTVLRIFQTIRPHAPRISPWVFLQLEIDMLQRTQWRVMPRCA